MPYSISEYESQIIDEPIENAIVITKDGEIYRCRGTLNGVYPDEDLKEKLYGADVTHNHPVGSDNEYSFSKNDINLFIDYRLSSLRGADERFLYEIDNNSRNIDKPLTLSEADEYSLRHEKVLELAGEYGYGYRRKRRK